MMDTQRYQFLYLLYGYDNPDDFKEKWVTCKKLSTACNRFLNWKPQDVIKVDYEVKDMQGNFHDISEVKGFEKLI